MLDVSTGTQVWWHMHAVRRSLTLTSSACSPLNSRPEPQTLIAFAQHSVRIVDGTAPNDGENRLQVGQLVHRAANRISAIRDQVGKPPGLQRATSLALATQFSAGRCVEPHRSVLVNRVLWP